MNYWLKQIEIDEAYALWDEVLWLSKQKGILTRYAKANLHR